MTTTQSLKKIYKDYLHGAVDDNTKFEEDIQRLSSWCSENYLQFNVKKTKEIVFHFRRNRNPPMTVNGETVKRVATFF